MPVVTLVLRNLQVLETHGYAAALNSWLTHNTPSDHLSPCPSSSTAGRHLSENVSPVACQAYVLQAVQCCLANDPPVSCWDTLQPCIATSWKGSPSTAVSIVHTSEAYAAMADPAWSMIRLKSCTNFSLTSSLGSAGSLDCKASTPYTPQHSTAQPHRAQHNQDTACPPRPQRHSTAHLWVASCLLLTMSLALYIAPGRL